MISIVVAAYNEEKGIGRTLLEVKKKTQSLPGEIIVVDDGSRDNTAAEAKKIRGVRIIRHARNLGKAKALSTGFAAARGAVLATIDADCTYPPEKLPEMVSLLSSRDADMIIGSRFYNRKRGVGMIFGAGAHATSLLLSRFGVQARRDPSNFYGNALFSALVSILTGKRITDASSGLRVMRKSAWNKIRSKVSIEKPPGLEWEVGVTTRMLRDGFVVEEVPIAYHPRVGRTKLRPFREGARFLKAILLARFS